MQRGEWANILWIEKQDFFCLWATVGLIHTILSRFRNLDDRYGEYFVYILILSKPNKQEAFSQHVLSAAKLKRVAHPQGT